MKRQPLILAGTALGLLMASAPLGAFPLQGGSGHGAAQGTRALPLMLAQAECPEGESAENCAANQAPAQEAAPAEQQQEQEQKPLRKKQREAQQPAAEQQAAPEPQPEQNAAPAQEAAPAPEPEQKPRRKKQREPAAEQEAAPQAEPEQNAAPAQEPASVAEPEQKPQRKKHKQAAEPAPVEEQPTQQAEPQQPSGEEAAPATKKEKLRDYLKNKQGNQQPVEAQPAEEAAPTPEQKPAEARPATADDEQPGDQAGEPQKQGSKKDKLRDYLKKKQQGGEAAPSEEPADNAMQPAEEGQPAGQAEGQAEAPKPPIAEPELPADTREQAMPKPRGEGKRRPKNEAPLPDSAKGGDASQAAGGAGEAPAEQPQADNGKRVPKSDSAAQTNIGNIGKIESVEAVRGKRMDRDQYRKDRVRQREERRDRDGGEILKEIGNRIIIKLGNDMYVDSRDSNSRLERHARDSYVEELPRGLTRYTIVRDDGTRVVTIRNSYGDIVRRSRITRDNREVVLYYVPEAEYGRIRGGYRDAGADLPPLRLNIPADEYILDAQYAEPDDYYTYLDAPPVEPVERIYSIDEVVHSARIRDKVRRVDLDTITFDTGSAEIGESQVNHLQALGDAINRILEQNPAETFLIEGHTDAVGSDESNLVLSDERAQSVAEALSSVFDIPPENLTTQGYGERYLKVNTLSANRDNRRVAVRRITPLVAPVARAQ